MKNERKEELKDEMKNRISMALKNPILQQGFEIICKENAELKEENIGLRAKINAINSLTPELEKVSRLKRQQLTKAKSLLAKWVELYNPKLEGFPKTPVQEETERFLKENK